MKCERNVEENKEQQRLSMTYAKCKNKYQENIIGENIFIAFPQKRLDENVEVENKIQKSLLKVLKNKIKDEVSIKNYKTLFS